MPVFRRSENGTVLAGAKLCVVRSYNDDQLDSWTSPLVAHYLSVGVNEATGGLAFNTPYRLRELAPPEGYQLGQDVSFQLRWDADKKQVRVYLTESQTNLESLTMYSVPVP